MMFQQNLPILHKCCFQQKHLFPNTIKIKSLTRILQISNFSKFNLNVRSLQILNNLQAKQSQDADQSQKFFQALVIYKELLNSGESLKFEAQNFRLGTLSNFNASHTQPRFSKSSKMAQDSVKKYIDKLGWNSSRAMQARIRFQNKYQDDRFLLQKDKFNYCWQQLESLYNPKVVEEINFEMLNILQDFDNKYDEFSSTLEYNKLTYNKQQGVFDSFKLMKRQQQQMRSIIQSRDSMITKLSSGDQKQMSFLSVTMNKSLKDKETIHKNLKIYRINEKIFSYYNTETNLRSFANARHLFSQRLQTFQSRIQQWDREHEIIKQISQKYMRAEELLKRKNYQDKQNSQKQNGKTQSSNRRLMLSDNKQKIQKIITQIQSINIRRDSKLYKFRKLVVRYILNQSTNYVQRVPIDLNNNRKISTSSQQQLNNQYGDEKQKQTIENQKQIFQKVLRTKDKDKKNILIQNKHKISQYVDYNDKLIQDNVGNRDFRQQLQKYTLLFKISRQIIDVVQNLKNLTPNQDFFKIITNHLNELSSKMVEKNKLKNANQIDQLLYSHIYDYSMFKNIQQSPQWQKFSSNLKSLKNPVFTSTIFTSSDKTKPIKQLVFYINSFIKQNQQKIVSNQLEIFINSIFKVNSQISEQLFAFESFYWDKITRVIRKHYEGQGYEIEQDISRSRSIDKSIFFTIPVLIYLNKNHRQVKIMNIDEILLKIVNSVYNQMHNMHQADKIINIVSLTLLLQYINRIYLSTIESMPSHQVEHYEQQIKAKQYIINSLKHLLTGSLLTSQLILKYDQVRKHNSGSNINNEEQQKIYSKSQYISTLICLQKFIEFKDFVAIDYLTINTKDSKFFTQSSQLVLSLQKQLKPLIINVKNIKGINNKDGTDLRILQNLFRFQEWTSQILEIIDSKSYSSSIFVNAFLICRLQQLECLQNLCDSSKSISQAEGITIKKIKKQSFYLKQQIDIFRNLQRQKVWMQYRQLIRQLLGEIQLIGGQLGFNQQQKMSKSNSQSNRGLSKLLSQYQEKIKQLDLKAKKILVKSGSNTKLNLIYK